MLERESDRPSGPPAGLPRRRRRFHRLSASAVRDIVRPLRGPAAGGAAVVLPSQGVNNQTYLVHPQDRPALVVKARPRAEVFRDAYREHLPWPEATALVQPAYALFT